MIKKMIQDLVKWGWSQRAIAVSVGNHQPNINRILKGTQSGMNYDSCKALEKLWKQEKRKHG